MSYQITYTDDLGNSWSVTLPSPLLGDSYNFTHQPVIRRRQRGYFIVFVDSDWGKVIKQNLLFENVTKIQKYDLFALLEFCRGALVEITDHNSGHL
jgi:hypothetical protein